MKKNRLLSFYMFCALLFCYMFFSDYKNIRASESSPDCWDCYNNGDGLKCYTGYWCGHKSCINAGGSQNTYCIMSGGGAWDCTHDGMCN